MTSELWELIDHAAGWRMPIRVKWVNVANAEVTIAPIPLLEIQRTAIHNKLRAACTHVSQMGVAWAWWIPKRSLEAIATKAPDGTDPENLVVWKQPEPDLAADTEFARAFSKQRGVPELLKNPEAVEFILGQINEFMLKWLVTHGRSINLGWGRLDAFPVRANWKNAIIGRMFRRTGSAKQVRTQYTAEDYEFLRTNIIDNTEWLTAYDKDTGTMRWSVEFTPSKDFHAAAFEREKQRRGHHRWKNNYLGAVIHSLRENIERLYEVIVAYSKETNLPFGIFPYGSSPRFPPKGYQPVRSNSAWYQTPLVTGAAIQEREGSAMVSEDASLPAVSNLQPSAENLRDAGTEMDSAGVNEA